MSVERFEELFREICDGSVEPDGLELQAKTVKGELMKEDQDYQGVRLSLLCKLQNMKINIDIDIGTGDAVTPAPVEVTYPVLLDFPAPVLLAYPRETVVAEKFQAMTALGMGNSRMKDFYDVWVLTKRFRFEGAVLSQAIRATFERRRTELPGAAPLALTEAFCRDSVKLTQWQAFLRKSKIEVQGTSFEQVIDVLRAFLMPPTEGARLEGGFDLVWLAGGPWAMSSSAGAPAGPPET